MKAAMLQQEQPSNYWTDLFDALRLTLLERAALPSGAASPERDAKFAANQETIKSDISWADGLTFNTGISDDDFWHIASTKPFYSGKSAGAIRLKVDRAGEWLRDYRALASPAWEEGGEGLAAYAADPLAYHNPKDLPRVLRGAINITRRQELLSGRSLVDIFVPKSLRDFKGDALRKIYKNLNNELRFGFVTTLHVMTDLGLPVVKTDRVLTRTIIRLGLVTRRPTKGGEEAVPLTVTTEKAMKLGMDETFSFLVQEKLREASEASGLSMRAIDWLLVKMGMDPDVDAGFVNTICGEKPQCGICRARPFCAYGSKGQRP